MRGVYDVLRRAFRIFSRKGARFLGAAVAFYALMSAAPLFIVILYVVGSVFGKARAESALWGGLSTWIAPEGLDAVRSLTDRLAQRDSGGILGTLLVIYGSTRLFRAVRRALNDLWGIDLEEIEAKRSRVKRYGIRYGTAFLLTLFVALLVAILIVVKSGFALIATVGTQATPGILFVLDLATSIGFAFVLFTALFRFLPETDVTWREAMTSSLVSTILFAIGSELVTMYVRHKHVSDLYEGAAAVVLAILWVYYSTQVFFLGACVGAALRDRDGNGIADRLDAKAADS